MQSTRAACLSRPRNRHDRGRRTTVQIARRRSSALDRAGAAAARRRVDRLWNLCGFCIPRCRAMPGAC